MARPANATRHLGEAPTQPQSRVHPLRGVQPVLVHLESFDRSARSAQIQGRPATLDGALDGAVIETAFLRKERVVVVEDGELLIIVGALRTQATPGVDVGDEFVVKAHRVTIDADHEVTLRSGAASFVLRARGVIESFGRDITTRATGIHRLVGRMLHLN